MLLRGLSLVKCSIGLPDVGDWIGVVKYMGLFIDSIVSDL